VTATINGMSVSHCADQTEIGAIGEGGAGIVFCDSGENICGASDGTGPQMCCDQTEICTPTTVGEYTYYRCLDQGEAFGGEDAGFCDAQETTCGAADGTGPQICCDQSEVCQNREMNGVTYYFCVDGGEIMGEGGVMCDMEETSCGLGCCDQTEQCLDVTVGEVSYSYCADGPGVVLKSPHRAKFEETKSNPMWSIIAVAGLGFVAGVAINAARTKRQEPLDIPMVGNQYSTI